MAITAIKDTFITKNSNVIDTPTSSYQDKLDTVDALLGCIPDTITLEESKKEHLNKI